MIIGIGSDLIDIRRIEKSLERHGQRFVQRIYTEVEQAKSEKANALHPYVPSKFEALMNRAEDILVNSVPRWHPFFESAYYGGGLTLGAGYAHHVSPYNMLDSKRLLASDNGMPIAKPKPTSHMPSRKTSWRTSKRRAPRAMRSPISRVRPATVYDMIPYSPTQASRRAKPAKKADSLASAI